MLTYNVPLSQCKKGKPYPDGHMECYDGRRNFTGNYTPMSQGELAAFRAKQQADYAQLSQALNQANAQFQSQLQ
ncbi:hypothetical protein [Novosphingobium cyanobacteriorum]|uniref:Uncharacterized protein n=1 Tax=Novosphingobium cyanobacteriorum TaxID=3024215 RepID=A0ABT6CGI9_9SPHN|nr:hypothetical protein [Novosphingobium cyanobacteriorum]MDF8333041.1 hypothetical protein [Novosphingobium cyanobacteriorum]